MTAPKNDIVFSTNRTCMFYAKNLTWYDGSATPGVAQGYDLDYSTTTCVPNVNSTTGNITSVKYVNVLLLFYVKYLI